MSRQVIRGTIRSRLLVNALVDPDEAARRLPAGMRPHATGDGTIVGCCLLDITDIRPSPLPAMVGGSFRAAAHRISAEWDGERATAVGVYVPLRLTHSRAAVALGGRVFPGVHRRASIRMTDDGRRLVWSVEAGDAGSLRIVASARDVSPPAPCEPIGGTCLAAELGLSPGHHGGSEVARMRPSHRRAHPVDVDHMESSFLASFTSAVPAPSYLVRDVDVTWSRA
jgi:hypothetical protein